MRDLRQIMCHHTGKKKTKHPHCHQNSLVYCGERGLSVLVWWGCISIVKLYTQSSIAVLFNIMIHVPPTSPSSLSPATIQRYLQATFIYPDHRNIIDISVRVFVDCYMYVVIYCEMQMSFSQTNPDSSCLHFSRQKLLLETQNVEFNSFRTIKI